jgi:hypothetical protein
MFPEMLMTADEIDAALDVQDEEVELLRETAGQYEELAGGYGIAVALRNITREVSIHSEAMRTQSRALRTACGQASGEGGTAHH